MIILSLKIDLLKYCYSIICICIKSNIHEFKLSSAITDVLNLLLLKFNFRVII